MRGGGIGGSYQLGVYMLLKALFLVYLFFLFIYFSIMNEFFSLIADVAA